MATRRPDAEEFIRGIRYRAWRRRTEIEVLVGDDEKVEVTDPDAEVYIYPKQLGAAGAITLCAAEYTRYDD